MEENRTDDTTRNDQTRERKRERGGTDDIKLCPGEQNEAVRVNK